MNIVPTALPEVLLITPKVMRDVRGAFWETWNRNVFAEAGLPTEWAQDNCSSSVKNVIRGIHYQLVQPQGKLVRATCGAVFDIAVDLRRSSPNFGRHVAVELSEDNGHMLYIPIGFGHGFAALTEQAGLAYKVTDFYCQAGEGTVLWNDADIAIPWPVAGKDAILSAKDCAGKPLRDAEVFE